MHNQCPAIVTMYQGEHIQHEHFSLRSLGGHTLSYTTNVSEQAIGDAKIVFSLLFSQISMQPVYFLQQTNI